MAGSGQALRLCVCRPFASRLEVQEGSDPGDWWAQVRARSEADRKAFIGLVKAVSRLEVRDGRKLVVLK